MAGTKIPDHCANSAGTPSSLKLGLLGGQVDALATGPASIVSHIKSGKVRALAHWGEGRLASLPDVPSF
ncbi:MAG: tripartite tricarboxylate transporter substrate-binding protein, partial [Betaproteobacteria bacterium]